MMSDSITDFSERERSPCGCIACEHCGGVELSDDCDIFKHNAIVDDNCSLPDLETENSCILPDDHGIIGTTIRLIET